MESSSRGQCPTNHFIILDPQNPLIDEYYVLRKRGYEGFKIVERSVAGVSKKKCLHYPVNWG